MKNLKGVHDKKIQVHVLKDRKEVLAIKLITLNTEGQKYVLSRCILLGHVKYSRISYS